ncbi:MAG: hypothetical protein RSD91_06920 [Clostridiales bacterium]
MEQYFLDTDNQGTFNFRDFKSNLSSHDVLKFKFIIENQSLLDEEYLANTTEFINSFRLNSIFVLKDCQKIVDIVNPSRKSDVDTFFSNIETSTLDKSSIEAYLDSDLDSNIIISCHNVLRLLPTLISMEKPRTGKTYFLQGIDMRKNEAIVIDINGLRAAYEKDRHLFISNMDTKYECPKPTKDEEFYFSINDVEKSFTFSEKLNAGAESVICEIDKEHVAKIYVCEREKSEFAKIRALIKIDFSNIPGLEAMPKALVFDKNKAVRGIVMNKVNGKPLSYISQGPDGFDILFPSGVSRSALVQICLDLLTLDIRIFTQNGIILIDNNLFNIYLDEDFQVHYLDLDSVQAGVYSSSCSSSLTREFYQNAKKASIAGIYADSKYSVFKTAFPIFLLLFMGSTPYVRENSESDDDTYFGDLTSSQQFKENIILRNIYSFFTPKLRKVFKGIFSASSSTSVTLIDLFIALEEYAEEIKKNTSMDLLMPEDVNPFNSKWERESRLNSVRAFYQKNQPFQTSQPQTSPQMSPQTSPNADKEKPWTPTPKKLLPLTEEEIQTKNQDIKKRLSYSVILIAVIIISLFLFFKF